MTADLASAAFRLTLRQKAVFQLAQGSKEPMAGSRGHLDATLEVDVVRARWAKNRNANIGVLTGARSGFWAFDVDRQHDGHEALAELTARHGELPPTVGVHTPSGGFHYWWKWPEHGPEIRCSTSRVGPGLDVRGEGGYIVAPPSILADGRCYRWVRNGARTIAEAPAWLIALTQPPLRPPRPEPSPPPANLERYVASSACDELERLESARGGQRNATLNGVAFNLAQFVKAGALPEDWARQQLETRAIAIGLPACEIQRTIQSAFEAAQPREFPQ